MKKPGLFLMIPFLSNIIGMWLVSTHVIVRISVLYGLASKCKLVEMFEQRLCRFMYAGTLDVSTEAMSI
jgi:hypothetical protein